MKTQDAYNQWAATYDTVINKTRDLEAKAVRDVLKKVSCDTIAEIGCGTGKNTSWLLRKCKHLVAVDFSQEMLKKAATKIQSKKVTFLQADITQPWTFKKANLITASLILEHIKDLDFIFQQASKRLRKKGLFYVCELHPFKQLEGSRAKFEKDGNLNELEYFVHHVTDYTDAAKKAGFSREDIREWFDEDNRNLTPRLISFLFQRK